MRGIRGPAFYTLQCDRITPARAGNTLLKRVEDLRKQDHPRPCGEYGRIARLWGSVPGSPPPVRGIQNCAMAREDNLRITPARAGNTVPARSPNLSNEDHPRPCGEYRCCSRLMRILLGSPPPVRGIHNRPNVRKDHHRITPARAGNTDIRSVAPLFA